MKDNRGLTLVELLLTVTILALVIAGAATFMLAGSKSFAKGSADSNVQGEAELAVNQIEDLIIDVNGGVDFTDDTDASTLTMYHVEAENSGVAVNKKRVVKWDKSDKKLYSSEWKVDKDGSGAYVELDPPVYTDQLLAENVTDFNVDLSDKYTETAKDGTDIEIVRSVVIRVDCLDGTGKSTYATTPTITLRNRLMISSSPDEIFEHTPAPDDSLLLYISSTGMEGAVPVRDRVTTVERGKVYNIFVMVNAGTNVNSLCDFTLEGETSGALSTITPEGVHIALDVNTTEPNDYLKITATYKTNSAKKVSGWVRVIGGNSKSLLGVKILPAGKVEGGDQYSAQFNSQYFEDGLTDEDKATFDYTWEVIDASIFKPFAVKNDKLSLFLDQQPGNYDQVVEIKLTLHCASTNQTVSDRVLYRTPPEGTTKGDSLVERGKRDDENAGYHGDNWYGFSGGPWIDQGSITYEAYFCDIYGNKISAYDPLLDQLEIRVQNGSYWFTFKENLPPENEYYIKIIVKYHVYTVNWDKTITEADWQYSRIHYIPAVSLWGSTIHLSQNFKQSKNFEFTYDIIGYYELEWASARAPYVYEVVEFNCDVPKGYTVTPEIGNTQARTETMIRAQCSLNVTCEKGPDWLWEHEDEIKPKSMKIKVYLKDHPNIYTYIDVLFDK